MATKQQSKMKSKEIAAAQKNLSRMRNPLPIPRGVPIIHKWTQNQYGGISGFVLGSTLYKDGESITTSPIINDAVGGSVVETVTGSK